MSWYLIVSIPDLCNVTNFYRNLARKSNLAKPSFSPQFSCWCHSLSENSGVTSSLLNVALIVCVGVGI